MYIKKCKCSGATLWLFDMCYGNHRPVFNVLVLFILISDLYNSFCFWNGTYPFLSFFFRQIILEYVWKLNIVCKMHQYATGAKKEETERSRGDLTIKVQV